MSIEMENPESLPGKIDAAWNLIKQIGLALQVGDIAHVKTATGKADRLLAMTVAQAGEQEYDGPGLIRAERARQIAEEGWTPEHDDAHTATELTSAAFCYLGHALGLQRGMERQPKVPAQWLWEDTWWKPSSDPKRDLVKAAALIAAELERLDRAEEKAAAGE